MRITRVKDLVIGKRYFFLFYEIATSDVGAFWTAYDSAFTTKEEMQRRLHQLKYQYGLKNYVHFVPHSIVVTNKFLKPHLYEDYCGKDISDANGNNKFNPISARFVKEILE